MKPMPESLKELVARYFSHEREEFRIGDAITPPDIMLPPYSPADYGMVVPPHLQDVKLPSYGKQIKTTDLLFAHDPGNRSNFLKQIKFSQHFAASAPTAGWTSDLGTLLGTQMYTDECPKNGDHDPEPNGFCRWCGQEVDNDED